MRPPPGPLFQSRPGYRSRRLGDSARLLPMQGLVLFMVPLLGGLGHSTSGGGLYIFGVWAALVLAAAVLSRPLGRRVSGDSRPDGPGSGASGAPTSGPG
jgi:hypothetical protein